MTYYTAGIVPPAPCPPVLLEAGVTWLALRWSPPHGVSCDDALTYSLDVEEEGSVSAVGFISTYAQKPDTQQCSNKKSALDFTFKSNAATVAEYRVYSQNMMNFKLKKRKPRVFLFDCGKLVTALVLLFPPLQGYGFQPQYNGDELSCTLRNLRRSTSYKFRVCTMFCF